MTSERKPVTDLAGIFSILTAHGYEASLSENSVSFQIGEQKFVAVAAINDGQLRIACQIMVAGDVDDSKEAEVLGACLAMNARITPWAIAMVTDSTDPDKDEPHEWPIIITDSMPIGDLSEMEVVSAIDSLWVALAEAGKIVSFAKN